MKLFLKKTQRNASTTLRQENMCVDFKYQTNSVPCLSDNSLGADVLEKKRATLP